MARMDDSTEERSRVEVLCFKQRTEKSAGGEVILMQWSPTMDLLAAALADHSVILNRLSWQRVWMIPPSEASVAALSWRPDGKVLAVGCSDGSVCLYSVEDGHALHNFSAGAPITHLCWGQLSEDCHEESGNYEESWMHILPSLPALDTSHGNFESQYKEEEGKHPSDAKQLKSQTKMMNLLVIGDEAGRIHLCVSGVFLSASVDISTYSGATGHVMQTWISHDFKQVSCTVMSSSQSDQMETDLCLQTISTALLSTKSCEMKHIALKFGHIAALLDYMNATLKSMHEAWEDLLLMMETKLANYSSTLPEGQSVGDELLVLLACGRARKELQTFLIDELSANGVKKLGVSLELSYTNIRKYLLSYLNSSIQSLLFHLGDVLGMSRWSDRFGVLGLSETAMQECINHLGTFALKSQELLLAIDQSLQSIRIFFLWLYTTILKLSDEPLPKDCKESLSPDELKSIIDFLRKRLCKVSEGDSQTFNLEVVGQYLVDEDLKYIEETPPSLWEKLAQEAGLNVEGEVWAFQPDPKKSLVQLFRVVHRSIDDAFALPMACIQRSFSSELNSTLVHYKLQDDVHVKNAQKLQSLMGYFIHKDGHYVYYPSHDSTCINKGSCDLTLQLCGSDRRRCFHVGTVPVVNDQDTEQRCHILSVQFYSGDALSILLQYHPLEQSSSNSNSSSPSQGDTDIVYHHAVAQLPIDTLLSTLIFDGKELGSGGSIESIDIGSILTQVCVLGVFKAGSLAVSGTRRLAAVLTSNGKKIRLFDVDAEEEEDI